jgi:threonine dehydrogenase-like Zn-dependent dehydrogenase
MWAQMLVAPRQFAVTTTRTSRASDLGEGQVLLEVLAGAVCGSDLPYFRGVVTSFGGDSGNAAARIPGFPMHEVVGEVLATRHPDLAVGERVVGWAMGFNAIADLVICEGEGLSAYDSSLEPACAVLLQSLACVLYAVERLPVVTERSVAIIGQGPMGVLFTHVLKTLGARHVVAIDPINRSDVAAAMGADEVVTANSSRWAASLREHDRPDVVVEAVGHQVSTLSHALRSVAFGGTVYYFGVPDDAVYPVDMDVMLRRNVTLMSGATIERRRFLSLANAHLADHPELSVPWSLMSSPLRMLRRHSSWRTGLRRGG